MPSGSPESTSNCQLVASVLDTSFGDDGTKFRTIFGNAFLQSLGDMKYVILEAHVPASQYYSLKTYGITNATHDEKVSYTTNGGTSWTAMTNNQESELNINYFYNTNRTQAIYTLWVNTTGGVNVTATAIQNWTINASVNYAPFVSIDNPAVGGSIEAPYNFTFEIADPNLDNLTGNLTVFNNTNVISVLANLTRTDVNYYLSSNITAGTFNLTLTMCENDTTDLYCGTDTHLFTFTVATVTSANLSCHYNSEPYYFIDGFDVFCQTKTVSNYSCVGMLSFNEQVIQVNPPPTSLRDADRITRFYDSDGNVVINFGRKGLRSGEELNMSIKCATSAQTLFYNATITPKFKDAYMVEDYTLWMIKPSNTRGMILLIFSIFIVLTVVTAIWRKGKQ